MDTSRLASIPARLVLVILINLLLIMIGAPALALAAPGAQGPAPAAQAQTQAPPTPSAPARAQAQAPTQTQAPPPAAPASLDAILKDVAKYDGGIDSGAAWTLRDYVSARKNDPAARAECEAKLLAFLKSAQTPTAKMAAGRALRVIATDTAVPALQALLADDRSADAALYALQTIPGPAAEKALVQSVSTPAGATSTAATKTGIIAALGERRAETAVPALATLLQQPAFAAASATALGRIGGDAAAAALVDAFGRASADSKAGIASAILATADRAMAAKNIAGANRLYEFIAADASLPAALRKAAAIGTLSSAGSTAPARLLHLLNGPDADLREAAITKIPGVFTADTIAQVAALLPTLPEDTQIQLLAVLATFPADRVGPAVLARLGSESEAVRVATMKALPPIGGPAAVRPLADRAATARGAEQTAARAALASLKGRAVDDEVVAQLRANPAEAIVAELLAAIGERRNFAAKPLVTSFLTSSPSSASSSLSSSRVVRMQAYRALRAIGTPSDIPLVLDALLAVAGDGADAERREAERTVVALGQKQANVDGRSRVVRARLDTEKTAESRARLIALLGMMGDPAALPVLRSALKDPEANVVDAAVRAIAAWPTSAAREDLMALARDLRTETHRLLAIQGLIRTIGLDAYRDAPAVVADLRMAAGFAWRTDERRLVLGVLGRFPCVEALDLARGFLQDQALSKEAQATIDRITPRLPKEAIRK